MSIQFMRVLVGLITCVHLLLAVPTWAQDKDGTLRGRVLDAQSEIPIERVNVVARREGDTQGTSTDVDGRFRLTLAPGLYTLEVSVLGYEGTRRAVTVQPGGTTTVRLSLSPREYSLNEIVVEDQRRETEAAVSTVQHVDHAAIETQDPADVSELAELTSATHVQTNSRGQTILYFRNAGDRQVGQF